MLCSRSTSTTLVTPSAEIEDLGPNQSIGGPTSVVEWTLNNPGTDQVIGSLTDASGIDSLGAVAGSRPVGAGWGEPTAELLVDGFLSTPLDGGAEPCGVSEQEDTFGMTDSTQSDGSTLVSVAGDDFFNNPCMSAPDEAQAAMVWRADVTGQIVTQVLPPLVISPPADLPPSTCACGIAVGLDSNGDVLAVHMYTLEYYQAGTPFLSVDGLSEILQNLLRAQDQKDWTILQPAAMGNSPTRIVSGDGTSETAWKGWSRINSSGQILTGAVAADGSVHSVLLTPAGSTSTSPVTVFSSNFDSQGDGALVTGAVGGSTTDAFTGTGGPAADLRVVSYYAYSPPECLGVNIVPGGSAYAYKTFGPNFATHDLSFNVMAGPQFKLPASSYVTIAGTEPI